LLTQRPAGHALAPSLSDHPYGTTSHVQNRANLPTVGLNPTILPHWPHHGISPTNDSVNQPVFTHRNFIRTSPHYISPVFNQNQGFRPQQAFGGNMSRGFTHSGGFGGGFHGDGNFNGEHGGGSFGGGARGGGGHR
jgi:hypothetical protein